MADFETIGSMGVEIRADLSKWSRDMDDLKKDAAQGGKQIEKEFNSSVTKAFDGVNVSAKDLIQRIEDLDKRWDKLTATLGKYAGASKQGQILIRERKLALEQLIVTEGAGGKSVGTFGNANKNARTSVRLLTSEIANSAGQTGRFGSIIGQLASGMLIGGWIGVGLAAGAAAINLISQNAQKLTQIIKEAVSKLVTFKDSFKDIKFEIDTGNIKQQTEFIENRIKQLQGNISGRDVQLLQLRSTAGSSETTIKILEKQNELDEKRIAVNEEYLSKLKEQKDLEDAIGITKSELNRLGIKELTTLDKINSELKDQKKIIDDLKTTLSDPNVKGEARLVLQNKLKQAQEDYNSLLGIQKEKEKNAVDEIIKKIQTENQLKALTKTLTTDILDKSKSVIENLLKQNLAAEDQVKLLQLLKQLAEERLRLESELSAKDKTGKAGVGPSGNAEIGIVRTDLNKEKEKESALFELRMTNLDNEFIERENRTNAYYDNLLKLFEGNSNAIAEIEKARELELQKLQMQRFSAGLSAASSISGALSTIVGSGNKFVNSLNKALEIAQAIAVILKSIGILSAVLGNPAGAFAALKEGGMGYRGKVTPYSQIPKFANGINFRVPNKYVNDSMLMRVSAREKVKVTPAHVADGDTKFLAAILGSIRAMNMNLSRLEMRVDVINNAPDINTQVVKNKKVENRLSRNGVNFKEQ